MDDERAASSSTTPKRDRLSIGVRLPRRRLRVHRLPRPLASRRVHQPLRQAPSPLGLDRVRLHDLRHFSVTARINARHPIPTVSTTAGHSQFSTTLDLYSHAPAGGRSGSGRLPPKWDLRPARSATLREARPSKRGLLIPGNAFLSAAAVRVSRRTRPWPTSTST